jgi:hypothetical protein
VQNVRQPLDVHPVFRIVGIWAELNMGWPKFNWKAKVMCRDDM